MSEPITRYVSQRRAGGFTFVELLTALVVVSALAGISAFNARATS